MPYAPRSYDAPGDWRYDPLSLVVLNADSRPEELPGLEYTVESSRSRRVRRSWPAPAPGRPPTRRSPPRFPPTCPSLIDLSHEVVADADTPAAKAAAIQAFLRDGDYTYSIEPLPGMGYEALENFLLATSWATASSSPRRWP